jgi:hypothetical protein
VSQVLITAPPHYSKRRKEDVRKPQQTLAKTFQLCAITWEPGNAKGAPSSTYFGNTSRWAMVLRLMKW